jgi:hypothetical protein
MLDERQQKLISHCLGSGSVYNTRILSECIEKACAADALPFEIIFGTPQARYGRRITFRPLGNPSALAAAFGFAKHPWGTPAWVGIRCLPDGSARAKAYHRLDRLDGRFALPPGLPGGLRPVMASLDGDITEVYLRFHGCLPWTRFVAECTACLAGTGCDFAPHPRPVPAAFCVSYRCQSGACTGVSVFADHRALPEEAAIFEAWSQELDPAERAAYELSFAAARSVGANRGPWHAMLSWTLESRGGWHRAVSLRLPMETHATPR